jgi:hypothetical protein
MLPQHVAEANVSEYQLYEFLALDRPLSAEDLAYVALAQREQQVWAQLPGLLALRSASGYQAAVAHLADLRDLAVHRGQRAAFDARLSDLLAPYATSAALQRRLREKKLMK